MKSNNTILAFMVSQLNYHQNQNLGRSVVSIGVSKFNS